MSQIQNSKSESAAVEHFGPKNGPSWREFESIIERLQRAFYPAAQIERNAKLRGQNSDIPRDIDIAIRTMFGPQDLLVVVECKDWKRIIDVKAVEAFVGVKEDVGAHVGVMISPKGFSRAAYNLAKRKQVSLFTYRDTRNEAWPNGLLVPVVLEAWILKPLAFYLKRPSGERIDFPSDLGVNLHDAGSGGQSVSISEMCRKLWEQHEPKTEGCFSREIPCSESDSGESNNLLGIGFQSVFSRTLRHGRLHFRGVVNEEKAKAHATSFEIEVIDQPTSIGREKRITPEAGGYGLIMKTTMVESHNPRNRVLQQLLFRGPLTFSLQGKPSMEIPLSSKAPGTTL